MSRALTRDRIEADLATVRQLIAQTPETRRLSLLSLVAREKELAALLGTLERKEGTNAEVVVSFDGAPVVGAGGIDARFAAEALDSYQKLVSLIASQNAHGDLAWTGPAPDADAFRLHISDVVHGSFGFELREIEQSLFGSRTADAVEESLELLAAATKGAEPFAEAIRERERVRLAAESFLGIMRKSRASVRLLTDRHDVSIDVAQAAFAAEVAASVRHEVSVEELPGLFGGVHIQSRRFEHTPNGAAKPIFGTLDPALDWHSVQTWQEHHCIVTVRVTRTFAGEHERRRPYVLLKIRQAAGDIAT